MNTNPTVILNGDQIYVDELIRENARLTIRHEADQQTIVDLVEKLGLMETAERAAQEAVPLKKELDKTKATLAQASEVIHYLMKSGDPCKVCAKTCKMGEECVPLWRGGADL